MKKILAFAGSNHTGSINQQLVEFTAALIDDLDVKVVDIKSWDIPIYSMDMDPDQTPELIASLIGLIQEHDGFIIASPEHNGGTPAFFKNILDWLSRRAKKVFDNKPVLLMSTSPGGGGGATNRNFLAHTLPYQGATIAATFGLPAFHENMKEGKLVEERLAELKEGIEQLKTAVESHN